MRTTAGACCKLPRKNEEDPEVKWDAAVQVGAWLLGSAAWRDAVIPAVLGTSSSLFFSREEQSMGHGQLTADHC